MLRPPETDRAADERFASLEAWQRGMEHEVFKLTAMVEFVACGLYEQHMYSTRTIALDEAAQRTIADAVGIIRDTFRRARPVPLTRPAPASETEFQRFMHALLIQ